MQMSMLIWRPSVHSLPNAAAQKLRLRSKVFLGRSLIHDMEETLGQFALYNGYLELLEPTRKLSAYTSFFARKAFQVIIQRYQVPLIIVNVKREEIVLWTG